jgi:hypothetical protein
MSKQPRDRAGRFGRQSNSEPEVPLRDELGRLSGFLPADTIAAWLAIAPVVPPHAYLSGGTALTAHIQHRVSRDLDFFTEQDFDENALVKQINQVGLFAPTLIAEGTVNGVFEGTKVQFLNAKPQALLSPTTQLGGVRLASMSDVLASKLKVIQDRGALRDYFDLMLIDRHIPMEDGLRMLVEKYRPQAPAALVWNVVKGLGYMGDVEDDPSLPVTRSEIESFWAKRQPTLAARLSA